MRSLIVAVIIPESVSEIGVDAFKHCEQLIVKISSSSPIYQDICDQAKKCGFKITVPSKLSKALSDYCINQNEIDEKEAF